MLTKSISLIGRLKTARRSSRAGILLTAIIVVALFSLRITYAQATTITFNDLTSPNRDLNGQHPTGIADWGSNKWYLSGPWGKFSTNSVSFLNESVISATFNFLNPTILRSVNVFNGGSGSTTVSLACSGNPTITQTLSANQSVVLSTNWTATCTTVTVGSSNGWWTNFDDFAFGAAGSTPTATMTLAPPTSPPTSVPSATLAATSTSTATSRPTSTLAATSTSTTAPTSTTAVTATSLPPPTASGSITFNDLSNPNRSLNGQYPTGVADWGSNKWYLSGPWGSFNSNSVSFMNESVLSVTFNFVNATVLRSVNVFNGGSSSSSVSLACTGNPTVTQSVAANQSTSITTNWATPCTTITVGSSNGWWTNFDDFAYGSSAATATLAPTVVQSATSTLVQSATPTLNQTSTVTPTRTPTRVPTTIPPTPTQATGTGTTWNNHQVLVDGSGKLVSWLPSPYPYDQLVKLTWNYIQNVPNTSAGIKHYLSYCCFYEPYGGNTAWYHNPAGLYAAFVDSLLESYPYTGNSSLITTVQGMLDYQLAHGTTPGNWTWANMPFASAVNGDTTYRGDGTSDRDGVNGIEPDKAAELGYAYIRFWELTGNTTYRDAAINIANTLVGKVRTGDATHSPWPFRVNAQTGAILEEYTSNMVASVKLFDELVRLNLGTVSTYQSVRNQVWNWVLSYPMQNNQWNAYFEDIIRDPGLNNKNQITPMETARYILSHDDPSTVDPQWQTHIPALIAWVKSTFGKGPYYSAQAIDEQSSCCSSYGLGSHTARWASINALWYERTGDANYKEAAFRAFNFATYFSDSQGVVKPTLDAGSDWYSDGYADYIKHFMSGIASIPEWSPAGENHILRSSSVVSAVSYGANQVSYTTFDSASRDRLRLNFVPTQVTVDGAALPQRSDLNQAGWVYNAATGVLDIRHDTGTQIVVNNSAPAANLNVAASPVPLDTATMTVTPDWTATFTLTPEASLSPSPTVTLMPTEAGSATATVTPEATMTLMPSATPTIEASPIPSETATATVEPSFTPLLPTPVPTDVLPTTQPDNQMPTSVPLPSDLSTPTLTG